MSFAEPQLLLPGLFALLITLVHFFLGGREIARPLLACEALPQTIVHVQYYCWHLVTIALAAIAGCFIYAAIEPTGLPLAWLATILSAAFAAWGFLLVVWKRQRHAEMPQWILFVVQTGAALWALW